MNQTEKEKRAAKREATSADQTKKGAK